MRPKIFTFRNFLLALAALSILGGLAWWGYRGFPLLFGGVPSTAGKIAFVWEKDGQTDLYLVSATGGEPVALNKDASQEGDLAFSTEGQHLAFTADRNQSGVRQLCLTEAAPNRKIITLTRTQSTKEQPFFRGDRDIFFLDSGKVGRTTMDASDSNAIFPTVENKRDNVAVSTLFAEGGINQYTVSQNSEMVMAAVKRERGQVLAIYLVKDKVLALLGSARQLRFQTLSDGSFVVLFQSGAPLKESIQVPTPKTEEEKQTATEQMGIILNQLASQNDVMEGQSVIVHFDSSLAPKRILPLPFVADGFAMAPDNKRMAIYISQARGDQPVGLFVGDLTVEEPPTLLYDKQVTGVSWSPDSTALAFLSEGALRITPITGTDSPLNVTQGKGKVTSLAWSPTVAKK